MRSRDGSKIAYRVRGEGRTIVFARGWITHLELTDDDPSVRAFFSRLEESFRVVRFDGRGNGLSERDLPDHLTLEHLVDDLAAVVDDLAESSVILWGSSWAGPTAVRFAAQNPQRVERLVLDGTFADGSRLASPERAESFLDLLATARTQPDAVYASLSYMTDPEPRLSHTARIDRVRRSIEPEALIALYTLLYGMDVTDALGSVECSTLVLHRTGSRAVPVRAAQALAEGIPASTFVGLDGPAHNPWEGDSGPVFAALAEFLDEPRLTAPEAEAVRPLTVSILFVDQVASTAQMRELGDEKGGVVLAAMMDVLLDATEPFHATPLAETGDGMVFTMPSALDAVAAAQVLQRLVAAHNRGVSETQTFRLRVGVHTGDVRTSSEGRKYGLAIALASRLCDLAGADQILVSERTRDAVVGTIGGQIGERAVADLKGIGPVATYEIHW